VRVIQTNNSKIGIIVFLYFVELSFEMKLVKLEKEIIEPFGEPRERIYEIL
jgi:hypothetical protein